MISFLYGQEALVAVPLTDSEEDRNGGDGPSDPPANAGPGKLASSFLDWTSDDAFDVTKPQVLRPDSNTVSAFLAHRKALSQTHIQNATTA